MKDIVLLIEDEKKTAEMLKRALESEGIEVVWAEDGSSALKQIERGKFDLIILDLKLPGMSGDEVLEKIRDIDRYVEVIVYTSYDEPPVMKNLINLGVDGYINKGSSADLWGMVETVKEKLDKKEEEELLKTIPKVVERVKDKLDPFSEEERVELLKYVPEGMFQEYAMKGGR